MKQKSPVQSERRRAEEHLFRLLIMHQQMLSCSGSGDNTQLNLTNWDVKANFLHCYNKIIKQFEEN